MFINQLTLLPMKKSYINSIVMLMVFSVFCNTNLFAKTTPSKNNAFFARTANIVFGNTFGGTKIAGAVVNNCNRQIPNANRYLDFTNCAT